ncbi:hypothetical protein BGZ65_001831 [Modicella reniformis]|uniref:Uncharacterized protein n=1 Tax=Modicella reniformis TaxID=1440133 RepID=A0A9P6SU37_9FUNG|nr:hypothetical protein BGZ65_001831 [Modicella reniformis]
MALSPPPSSSGLQTTSISNTGAIGATGSGGVSSGILAVPSYQVQQDQVPSLVSKRSATWRYLQRVHQGGMVLYNTAMLSETDLRRGYSDEKMQRRSLQYFLLGTSLATILEIPNFNDCLKAVHGVVQEYEYFTASESKSKMMFFRNTSRRVLLDMKSFEETDEYSLLEVRQLPFNLDYVITFASLCDMIAQVYEKLGSEDRVWNLTNTEMFQKIDNRFKKILTLVSRELETMAREVMADELNAMDPLGTPNDHDWDT